jgi:MarR family transcriptional regulator, organic hydroperoxide resistance regulator
VHSAATPAVPLDVRQVLALYPQIYFACHTRHVRDQQSGAILSSHQASVLDHLDEIEPTALAELAAHMGVTASTMSITVERLVRGGYVSRIRDLDDTRRVQLRLTESGVRIKSEKSVLDPERVREVLAKLTREERRRALAGLALLARASQQAMHAQAERKKGDHR